MSSAPCSLKRHPLHTTHHTTLRPAPFIPHFPFSSCSFHRHVWLRSKAVQGGGCIGATDDPSSWDSPLTLNSTDRWGSGRGGGSSYVPPWEIIFELVRVSRADRVPPFYPPCPPVPPAHAPSLRTLRVTDAASLSLSSTGGQPLCRRLDAAAINACSRAAAG